MITRKVISQPIITRKVVSQPIIKQRIVQTPIIRKKIVSRPVYTEKERKDPIIDEKVVNKTIPINIPGQVTIREQYIQPTIHTKEEKLNVIRGDAQVIDYPAVTKAIQNSVETIYKDFNAPAKEIITQPIIEKTIVNNKERVNFIPSAAVTIQKEPITREAIKQHRHRTETIVKPAKEIIKQTYIQPIIQRESVDVKFNRQPDQTIEMEPRIENPFIKTVQREQLVTIPGQKIITQPIIQEIQNEKEIHYIQQPKIKKIPMRRAVPVPHAVLNKVPVIRKIPIPIENKNQKKGMKIYNYSNLNFYGGSSSSSSQESEEGQKADGFFSTQGEQYSGNLQNGHGYQSFGSSAGNSFDQARLHQWREALLNNIGWSKFKEVDCPACISKNKRK